MRLNGKIQVRITKEMARELTRLAAGRRLRGDRESDIVREAIADYIQRQPQKEHAKP